MITGAEKRERRKIVNKGATLVYLDKFPKDYLNRQAVRKLKHKIHRSKWQKQAG